MIRRHGCRRPDAVARRLRGGTRSCGVPVEARRFFDWPTFDWEEWLGEHDDFAPGTDELDVDLRAPFPWFGGKSRAAKLIWARLGDCINYVEPFGGSGAVLLARPAWHRARVETYNDLDALLVNFWRAVAHDPEAVAAVCDWPVAEVDLHARHRELVRRRARLAARLEADPRAYDVVLAGWWAWGASCWIGDGWCNGEHRNARARQRPALSSGSNGPKAGAGIHAGSLREVSRRMPDIAGGRHWDGETPQPRGGKGIHGEAFREPTRKLPNMIGGNEGSSPQFGRGVHAGPMRQLLDLGGSTKGEYCFANVGKGVNSGAMREPQRQLPNISGSGDGGRSSGPSGVHAYRIRTALYDVFARLARRLRYVRFPCGSWTRVVTPAVTWRHGLTGIVFDSPYDEGAIDYAVGGRISSSVREWCLEVIDGLDGVRRPRWDFRLPNGSPAFRIVVCGYDGEHDALAAAGWEVVPWKARGGFANQRRNGTVNDNARRERLWCSPHCLRAEDHPGANLSLFGRHNA